MSWTREQMCERASKELENGFYVNLGIGMPTLVANYISEKNNITLQSENGMLGMGPFPKKGQEDADLINAGKQTITELSDTSFFSFSFIFSIIFFAFGAKGMFVLSVICISSIETIGGRSIGFLAKKGRLIAVIKIKKM